MSEQQPRRGRGGYRGRGGGRGRGGPRGPKPQAPQVAHLQSEPASASSTPLASGMSTPIASGTQTPNKALTTVKFADFPQLSRELVSTLPFEYCTEVQAATLPAILDGHDVLAQAKTGTGKTLAFLVPSIQRLLKTSLPDKSLTSILVLSPTRELASQIADAALTITKGRLGVQCVVGGTNINTDVKNLKGQRADILVATPGRLLDLIENNGVGPRFAQLRSLVLDEADRLLDQGFRRELVKILESLPNRASVDRQTLLFSATLPEGVHSISSIALKKDHKFITTLKDEDINAHKHVVQELLVLPSEDLITGALEVLKREEMLANERGGFKVMVFLPTARAAGLYYEIFSNLPTSYPVWEIHSRMSQPKRTKSTDAFRATDRGVLFSSDVTARGIDVQGVTAVIQVGLPSSGEQYVHRLGRTARAGAQGHGVLILADFEQFFLRDPTIKTFSMLQYPAMDASSKSHAQALVDAALANVSEEAKGQAYQAWLGYYNSSLKKLGWSQTDLVRHANDYARNTLKTAPGRNGWEPPALQAKTIGKMGLKGVPGLNREPGPSGGGGGRNGSGQKRQGDDQQQQQQQAKRFGAPGSNGGSLLQRMQPQDGANGFNGEPRGQPNRGRGRGRGGRGRGAPRPL